jgi:hypothetical protein
MLRRMAAALAGETTTRAWTLTGPYGSGKSSLALLITQALAGEDPVRKQARKFLTDADPDLAGRLFGPGTALAKQGRLFPVLVTGSRQSLDKAFAAALAASLRTVYTHGRPRQIIGRLESLATQSAPAAGALAPLFAEAVNDLREKSAGVLLIVDELGKFLEFGASHPEQGDVFALQELAEVATRSTHPFLFLTILHQALDRYAAHLSPGRRSEWAKVQGRFEDVVFEERSEQLLRLLAHAVRHDDSHDELKPLQKKAKALAKEAVEVGIRAGTMPANELHSSLTACYPLHPLTAVVLGPLFRLLAQNERSLFAFLASSEPFGFRAYLHAHTLKDGPYRLDHLYDYVMVSLGPTLFAQHRGKLWAEVQTALDRLHDAGETQIRLAKTIGLLQALGPAAGFPASATVLKVALHGSATAGQVDDAIQELTRRSVVVFRRHTGSFALWEGSDIDIEDRLRAAAGAVEREQSLAPFLTRQSPPQPLIARRHYFQTGTLRYFETVYVGRADLHSDLFSGVFGNAGDADGRLLLCLPRDTSEREVMREQIRTATVEVPVVAALPDDVFELRELCHELACLTWVANHTPELHDDRTAKRELAARLAFAEQNLRIHLDRLFSPSNPACAWFSQGKPVMLTTVRDLSELLSRACDEVYQATPPWRNELINRRALSSNAAAARRNLIEAVFEHPEKEGLGFEGHPPERSMYETLLSGARLHRKHGGEWGFHPPDWKAKPAERELWKAVEQFLADTDGGRMSVEQLFSMLRLPPFGLKDGVLPVLLAAVLMHFQTQVALYEEGSFVPRPSAAVFERLCRTPAKFDLQRFRIAGPRAEVFGHYAAMIQKATGTETDLLAVVKPMVRLAKDLPEFVTKTKTISDTAQKVLKAVREARQPDKLLFADLPAACGFAPFSDVAHRRHSQHCQDCQLAA